MAEKLDMKSMDITQENIKKIQALFPDAVTEVKKDGEVKLAIDFDVLKQNLSDTLIDDKQERYQMTWPEKSKAKVLANSRIYATLRPDKEKSVDFDNTQNLYIEGDNLDVLKLLRETYLGKVKMIYIDPPYNTGNDFVYEDDFAQSAEEYSEISGDYDDQGNRLVKNTDTNGRFHTDWLNMMYPRLKVARDLLTDDGVVFISIDDNEQANLKKVCDEVFGVSCFEGTLIWKTKTAAKGVPTKNMLVTNHDYVLVYSRNKHFNFRGENRDLSAFSNPDNDPRGLWKADNMKSTTSTNYFSIIDPKTGNEYTKNWAFSKETIEKMISENKIIWPTDANGTPRQKRFLSEMTNDTTPFRTLIGEFQSETATNTLKDLFDGAKVFDFSKHLQLMKLLAEQATNHEDIILDFFSGSATTAHAVMQLNAEDGGNRKFIMVQLPEVCDEKSEAAKAGYKTICDIGEERIRRAGKKIKEEAGLTAQDLDIGFRVLKLDSSNMQDVYYNPAEMTQTLLDATVDNVKPDRTPIDLLFQVMLDLGVELSAKIEEKTVAGKTFYAVNGNDLVACFDDNLTNEVITEIAKLQPLYAAFKDKSFSTDSVGINNEQIFKTFSPATVVKVI